MTLALRCKSLRASFFLISEMDILEDYITERTVNFVDIMNDIPPQLIIRWLKGYREDNEYLGTFEEYTLDHSYMLVDSAYTKIKHYSVFMLDKMNPYDLVTTKTTLGPSENSKFILDYFKDIWENVFLDSRGKLDENRLKEWAKYYPRKHEIDSYTNLVENLNHLDLGEFKSMHLVLMIQNLGVTIENYFELTELEPISLEEAEEVENTFVDLSDKNISLEKKFEYIKKFKLLSCDTALRKVLYRMSTMKNLEQPRTIKKTIAGLVNLGKIQKLSQGNQEIFCETWQKMYKK